MDPYATTRDMRRWYGFDEAFNNLAPEPDSLVEHVNLKLYAAGLPIHGDPSDYPVLAMAESLLSSTREKSRLLAEHRCPADQHIHEFLEHYLGDAVRDPSRVRIPSRTLVLDRHGLARALSLPPDRDSFESDIVSSYRVRQGVCHNPRADRRTTKGVFHIAEGGLPIPGDKKAVPKTAFAALLERAIDPPAELLRLPFTDTQEDKAETWCSLLLRPLVAPCVPGVVREKRLEVRFFAPGNLVCNLDFVESIFGNAGDPYLPANDARLDINHWTGHTGCVILAPHLCGGVSKRDLGLPPRAEATPRQVRDGMCWDDPDEPYNDGQPFKLCARDNRGVMVTLIADNYFGYCKKEVKTMISLAANLYGLYEEEHAGGALVFPRRDHGEDFQLDGDHDHTYGEMLERLGDRVVPRSGGYAVDAVHDDIRYVPETAHFDLHAMRVTWPGPGGDQGIPLRATHTYVAPSGYKVHIEKPGEGRRWRIVGTAAEGTSCHKPCTVSGGGKSEISKPITDAMVDGSVYVHDVHADFERVQEIIDRDYADRYREPSEPGKTSRELLSADRSLGSVIKLLNPNPAYTDEYNAWVSGIPSYIRDLVLVVKRFYKPSWGDDWAERFFVDQLDDRAGHILKYRDREIRTQHLRVGFAPDGSWRTFSLRKDFMASEKIQLEDDITASVIVPTSRMAHLPEGFDHPSCKFLENCEHRLFQRPDDAIVRGYDKTAERDFSGRGGFFSNYEPLPRAEAQARIDEAIRFDHYTEPLQRLIRDTAASEKPDYFVLTSDPRIVDGVRTRNPRYLQVRPDIQDPRARHLADIGVRLRRRVPSDQPVRFPVNAVLPGRRHNPPDPEHGIRALAVYNPIHYQELPELFMDYIASLTGKSPSTTGAGSEGALTKGPFNALPPIIDLNNALVGHLVTGYSAFVTAAGHVGPKYRVAHDVSLLIPELWARMRPHERDPAWLIERGYFEPVPDFEHEGRLVLGSRLGYRMTDTFAHDLFGRVFSYPGSVFPEEMLKPELQDLETYVDGIRNIVETMERVARLYLGDGSIDHACPPLRALLHIMAEGEYEGKDVHHPDIRALFDPATIRDQDWYRVRLETRRRINADLHSRNIAYVERVLAEEKDHEPATLDLARARLATARERLGEIQSPAYLDSLVGTIGADPMPWV